VTKAPFSRSICGLALAGLLSAGFVAPAHATWSLVWADEFNGAALSTTDWNYATGTGCPGLCGWGNNELEYYRSQNVAVTGGNLVITAKAESFSGSSYTSGKITTKGKHSFLYGRIEMRAKLPTGGGIWPAFWMMPEADVYGGWAASGEIDIMEAANATTSVGGTIHYGGTYPNNTSSGGSYSIGGANFASAFHVYAVEWTPDTLRWSVDGVTYFTSTSAQWYSAGAPGNLRAPFDQAFYILLNLAVGGNYTGCTSARCVTAALPQQYLVDYVRVYADIVNTPPTVSITSPAGGAVPAGNVTIDATASDTDGTIAKVEFYNGFSLLGEDAVAPYSFTWNSVANGCYDVNVRAIDNQGGVATSHIDLTVGTGCGQAPYLGAPFALPARVQAEAYDAGGEGVAYHDADAANNGGQYRPGEGVDIEASTDAGGGYNVGWINPGEYAEYTVSVPASGSYPINVRAASLSVGGTFHLEFNGNDATGNIVVPATGGWQTWTTVSTTATLTAGPQVMRFVPTAGEFNLNYFDVVSAPAAVLPDGGPARAILHAAYPNPFNRTMAIRYDLQARAPVRLAIFDVRGGLIKTLLAGETIDAGSHEVAWDGRDATGRVTAAGIYFYRLDAGRYTETRRLVRVE
jgi:beta-glucanase (GH16 family)